MKCLNIILILLLGWSSLSCVNQCCSNDSTIKAMHDFSICRMERKNINFSDALKELTGAGRDCLNKYGFRPFTVIVGAVPEERLLHKKEKVVIGGRSIYNSFKELAKEYGVKIKISDDCVILFYTMSPADIGDKWE